MKKLCYILILVIMAACSKKEIEQDDTAPALFKELDAEITNLNFSNTLTETDSLNILDYLYYYNGGGVAIGDINNDSLPDIFLTGNQVPNKLFLNKGNLQFEDITETAGVSGNSDWNTGTAIVDINGDNLLDIYVCAVVGINGLKGKNELFINNGNGTFTEKAADFGLDFQNYSTNAAFFDYDNDGDLDMYLLNHAVHTVNTYGPAEIREKRNKKSGDKLLRNDGDHFTDVSEEAGIYGGSNGYGLGIATADFNNDGFTDIYISNDFHEDDFYYLNNGDGTFTESLKSKFGHTSRFSMGSDAADVNNDGFLDILTLDMLPDDEKVIKTSMGDDSPDIHKMKSERLHYHDQFSRNMLQINQGGEYFQDLGLISGLAATDWSWSALFADYDLDGIQDVFISTGIPKRPNDYDYIKYVSNNQIQKELSKGNKIDKKAIEMMPSGAVANRIFKGSKSLNFKDLSGVWISKDSIMSTGSAYADLDNDGDLDIITNNINSPARIYENLITKNNKNYLKIKLEYKTSNIQGIGSKAIAYQNGNRQIKQLFTTRGFQSASEAVIHFGFPETTKIDSLLIIWPNNSIQKLSNIDLGQTLYLKPEENLKKVNYTTLFIKNEPWFTKVDSLPGLDYEHKENRYQDFDRQKLIPYKISDRGPAVVVKDINGDGKEDIFFGSAKFDNSAVYFQTKKGFEKQTISALEEDIHTEDISAVIEDFDNNGENDLLIVSGGGEYYGENKALLDRLYLQQDKNFSKSKFPEYFENGSVVKAADYDSDGDIDLFVGGAAVSNDFGKISQSFLLKNENGNFSIDQKNNLGQIGMITDATWTDFNNDGQIDLIVVGEWMAPKFYENQGGKLTAYKIEGDLKGLWQTIAAFDIDDDGDKDYLLGNWGLNTKLSANRENPLKMYYLDFDTNGSTETILAQEKNGNYYPVNGLDMLVGQLSYLRKKFPNYKSFAGKTVEEIFSSEKLNKAEILEVETLASGYLLNENGNFSFKAFKNPLQISPITSFLEYDFNKDDKTEVLIGGNYFGTIPYHGKFDQLAGIMLQSVDTYIEAKDLGINFTQKALINLDILNFENQDYLLVTFNNDKPEIYKLN
ncbi:VCBS repeat-containing protein [Zunongwangia endophytica]|uniref:VCBS repeat-containing protein n=1 Tax=Zunongwangia endophytica TaxID=1808945 RepID=A0ABV8HA95_9FLAO|nr:VCBS repeat-containing protein [Zunongwangia endophytica]MDN3593817.1 VCBS repeat-containing protein [Zunongwangia endophytica]